MGKIGTNPQDTPPFYRFRGDPDSPPEKVRSPPEKENSRYGLPRDEGVLTAARTSTGMRCNVNGLDLSRTTDRKRHGGLQESNSKQQQFEFAGGNNVVTRHLMPDASPPRKQHPAAFARESPPPSSSEEQAVKFMMSALNKLKTGTAPTTGASASRGPATGEPTSSLLAATASQLEKLGRSSSTGPSNIRAPTSVSTAATVPTNGEAVQNLAERLGRASSIGPGGRLPEQTRALTPGRVETYHDRVVDLFSVAVTGSAVVTPRCPPPEDSGIPFATPRERYGRANSIGAAARGRTSTPGRGPAPAELLGSVPFTLPLEQLARANSLGPSSARGRPGAASPAPPGAPRGALSSMGMRPPAMHCPPGEDSAQRDQRLSLPPTGMPSTLAPPPLLRDLSWLAPGVPPPPPYASLPGGPGSTPTEQQQSQSQSAMELWAAWERSAQQKPMRNVCVASTAETTPRGSSMLTPRQQAPGPGGNMLTPRQALMPNLPFPESVPAVPVPPVSLPQRTCSEHLSNNFQQRLNDIKSQTFSCTPRTPRTGPGRSCASSRAPTPTPRKGVAQRPPPANTPDSIARALSHALMAAVPSTLPADATNTPYRQGMPPAPAALPMDVQQLPSAESHYAQSARPAPGSCRVSPPLALSSDAQSSYIAAAARGRDRSVTPSRGRSQSTFVRSQSGVYIARPVSIPPVVEQLGRSYAGPTARSAGGLPPTGTAPALSNEALVSHSLMAYRVPTSSPGALGSSFEFEGVPRSSSSRTRSVTPSRMHYQRSTSAYVQRMQSSGSLKVPGAPATAALPAASANSLPGSCKMPRATASASSLSTAAPLNSSVQNTTLSGSFQHSMLSSSFQMTPVKGSSTPGRPIELTSASALPRSTTPGPTVVASAPNAAAQLQTQREQALQKIISNLKVPTPTVQAAPVVAAGTSVAASPGAVARIAPPTPALLEQLASQSVGSHKVPAATTPRGAASSSAAAPSPASPVSKAVRAQALREQLALQIMASVKLPLPGAGLVAAGGAVATPARATGSGPVSPQPEGLQVRSKAGLDMDSLTWTYDRPVSIMMVPDSDGSACTVRP